MPDLDQIIAAFSAALDDLRAYEPPTDPADPTDPTPPATGTPAFFTSADWLWVPIPANPALDPQSASWAQQLAQGKHVALTSAYATTLITIGKDATPKRAVCPLSSGWGSKQLNNVPVPSSAPRIASGGDKAVAIIDNASGRVFSLWSTSYSSSGWRAASGSDLPISGDGREAGGDTSTGSNLARAACIVTQAEVAAGVIPHALFFSTDIALAKTFRFPATKTDGSNMAKVANPIPEGARVQLDPSIDLSQISGITKFELAVGRALQTHGMYVGDNGGSRVSISCELGDYGQWGAGGDYYGFPHLPWSKLRVLKSWNGA